MEDVKIEQPKQVFAVTKHTGKAAVVAINWDKKEDEKLKGLVLTYRERHWKKIAAEMEKIFPGTGFTAKKCRERWCNSLNPLLNKTSLTEAEELFLVVYHHEYKNLWTLIAKKIPKRSNHLLKNNFSSIIRKICRKVIGGEEERVITALYFLQAVYASYVINEFVMLAVPEDASEQIAPIHLYTFVKEKKVTTQQCITFLQSLSANLRDKYKEKLLKKLPEFNSMDKYKQFFDGVATKIKMWMPTPSAATESGIVRIIEEQLGERTLPSPFDKSPPLATQQLKTEPIDIKEGVAGSSAGWRSATDNKVTPDIFSPFQSILNPVPKPQGHMNMGTWNRFRPLPKMPSMAMLPQDYMNSAVRYPPMMPYNPYIRTMNPGWFPPNRMINAAHEFPSLYGSVKPLTYSYIKKESN